jgi:ubiquinone/menaquinone biosynthesis C-methylase UbiE
LGQEVNLLARYPKADRNIGERASSKTDSDRAVARQFGFDFFDGSRSHGYGGLRYHEKYWTNVAADFVQHYNLAPDARVLDVGCAKGFMLYDLKRQFPKLSVRGIDISSYAIEKSHPEIAKYTEVADAKSLPFKDNSFDLVISINTIHNLDEADCGKALREIERVSKKDSFVVVDAYQTDEQLQRMQDWNLTALTIKSTSDWVQFFKDQGYSGDYYWFMP